MQQGFSGEKKNLLSIIRTVKGFNFHKKTVCERELKRYLTPPIMENILMTLNKTDLLELVDSMKI